MKVITKLAALALLLTTTSTSGFGYAGNFFLFLPSADLAALANAHSAERVEPKRAPVIKDASFAISTFDRKVVAEFSKAWRASSNGTYTAEAVVLILQMADGSFSARSQGFTNEYKKFTFPWHPAAVAIVHTHPNGSDPLPQEDDIKAADKYRVPVFTLTVKGMFVYDPFARKISKVQDGLDWLNPLKWAREIALK